MKTDYSHIPAVFVKEAFYSVQEFVTIYKMKDIVEKNGRKTGVLLYCILYKMNG